MIDVTKVEYHVIVVTADSKQIDITNAVKNLSWEENEGQLAMKLSFDLYNAVFNGAKLSSAVKIGCLAAVKAKWGSGSGVVAYCKITEVETSITGKEEMFRVTAYDCLYDMQKSSDNIYYSSGKKTKSALTEILKSWSLQISEYTGPNITHSALVYKNKTIADIVLDILDLAKKKGGCKAIIRADRGKVAILKEGSNSNVYCFGRDNSTSSKFKRSTANIVTRVKIYSTIKNSEKTKLEKTVNGKTEYGIRQKIISKSSSEKNSDAEKEAKEILEENGSPEDTRTFECPDVPEIRKGDKICYTSGSTDTYYIVTSIQHNGNSAKMTMKVSTYKENANGGGGGNGNGNGNGNTTMIVTAKSGLNLREKANGKILLTMPKGSKCVWDGKTSGNWYHVTSKGTSGYAYKSWLKKS